MSVPADVVAAIRNARSIVIATHSPMDGDGMGCGLALMRCLNYSDYHGQEEMVLMAQPVLERLVGEARS